MPVFPDITDDDYGDVVITDGGQTWSVVRDGQDAGTEAGAGTPNSDLIFDGEVLVLDGGAA